MISDPLKSRLAGAAQDIVDLELKPKFKGSSEPIRHNNLHDLQAPTRARSVMGVIIVSLIALTVWAAFGKIDQVTRAQAVLMSAERTQLVQTPDGGVLTELHVKEGQHVKACGCGRLGQ